MLQDTGIDAKYEILGQLGKGGMGTVYRAHSSDLERDVAIKVMHIDLRGDDGARERFTREAKILANLQHPNILTIYSFGLNKNYEPYFVTELLEGRSLECALVDDPIALDRWFDIFDEVCAGLHFAHEQSVLHRDIKPANIFIRTGGTIKILDFGLAKGLDDGLATMTQPGDLLGSPIYMAPELFHGVKASAASDIYSLGCIMYEALAQRPPFDSLGLNELAWKITHEPHTSLRFLPMRQFVPIGISDLIDSMLEKSPEKRPKSLGRVRETMNSLRFHTDTSTPLTIPELESQTKSENGEVGTTGQSAQRSRTGFHHQLIIACGILALAAVLTGFTLRPQQQRNTYAADVYLDAATMSLNQKDRASYRANISKVFDAVHHSGHPSSASLKHLWKAVCAAPVENNYIEDCVQILPYSDADCDTRVSILVAAGRLHESASQSYASPVEALANSKKSRAYYRAAILTAGNHTSPIVAEAVNWLAYFVLIENFAREWTDAKDDLELLEQYTCHLPINEQHSLVASIESSYGVLCSYKHDCQAGIRHFKKAVTNTEGGLAGFVAKYPAQSIEFDNCLTNEKSFAEAGAINRLLLQQVGHTDSNLKINIYLHAARYYLRIHDARKAEVYLELALCGIPSIENQNKSLAAIALFNAGSQFAGEKRYKKALPLLRHCRQLIDNNPPLSEEWSADLDRLIATCQTNLNSSPFSY